MNQAGRATGQNGSGKPLAAWTIPALLLAVLFTPAANAAPRIPLTLSKAQYATRAGGTVKLDLPADSSVAVHHGNALHSRTTPAIESAPFATADTTGDLVIAVPASTPPGRYVVDFDLTANEQIRAAAVLVSVAPAAQVPVGSGTPVILLNGWQAPSLTQLSTCPTSASDGSDTFGSLPKNLPVWTTFFDNCVECPSCPIEMLGAHLGQRIDSLVFSDGTPVQAADVVAHSMGGLIVRSYLAGKSQTSSVFAPPADHRIRKAVFIGTPHFGSFLATNFGIQSTSLRPGSQFLWDLSRWNQGDDDLREVDALSIVGNASRDNKSDGVVSLTSASVSFSGLPDARTRIINACHTDGALAVLLCSTTQGIASSAESQQIVSSFLQGTTAWASIGHPPLQDPVLSNTAGRFFAVFNAGGTPLNTVSSLSFAGVALNQNSENQTVFYSDFLPKGSAPLTYKLQGQPVQITVTVDGNGYAAKELKDPPFMAAIQPAASAIHTLNIAPGSLISIFGNGLAASTVKSSFPWPTSLADVTVTANQQPLQLLYAGDNQINAYLPANLSGLVTVKLTNARGQHSLNVMTTDTSPAIFSADSSGTGIAAAIHASTGRPVTSSDPAVPGEYIEIYGTGFGSTQPSGDFEVTSLTPTLTVGGISAMVSFCGVPRGGVGLYQLNFIVPDGLPAGKPAEMVLTLGKHDSNSVSLPLR